MTTLLDKKRSPPHCAPASERDRLRLRFLRLILPIEQCAPGLVKVRHGLMTASLQPPTLADGKIRRQRDEPIIYVCELSCSVPLWSIGRLDRLDGRSTEGALSGPHEPPCKAETYS
jgi:hypothetical protein